MGELNQDNEIGNNDQRDHFSVDYDHFNDKVMNLK